MLSIFKRTKKHAPKSTQQPRSPRPEMFTRDGRQAYRSVSEYKLALARWQATNAR